jgi:hypothetical protein
MRTHLLAALLVIAATSRKPQGAIGSMPNPPCGVGLVGVPYPLDAGITTEAGWRCVVPPVACPAFTEYREQPFLGTVLRFCTPTEGFFGATVAPTPTATPTPWPTPASGPAATPAPATAPTATPTPGLRQVPYVPTRRIAP